MYRGVLIKESLVELSVLDRLHIVDTKIVDISLPADDQTAKWTVLTFEINDAQAAAIAQALADELALGPWYVDFNNGRRSYVVFSGRVFTYVRGDGATLRPLKCTLGSRGFPSLRLTGPCRVD